MSHAGMIQELQPEGERWRISVFGLSSGAILAEEMFPFGIPAGVTMTEDVVIEEPDLIGSFLVGGLTSDTVQHMDAEYAEHFHAAGLVPHGNSMSMEGTPQEGMVRTWLAGVEDPYDMAFEEASELYVDNWIDVQIPELTVYDLIDDQTVTLVYANGMTYPIPLNSVEQSQMPAAKLLNHSNYLVIPVDESMNPVLSGRTCPRTLHLRVELNEADANAKAQQIEIGYLINTFSDIIKRLATESRFENPVDVFRSGLGH